MEKLVGLVVPPFTPMHADGKIDLDRIADLARLYAGYEISGLFVCGSTGESFSLTVAERIQIVERWSEKIDHQMKLMVHVGHNCLESAKTLAQHAMQIGADSISACSPSFFKPATLDELIDFMVEVTGAAPNLPFYYYHIPSVTGVHFPMRLFLEKAAPRIPSLCGIKYTSENLYDLGECLTFQNGRFDLLFGCDEMLLGGLAIGVNGAIGTFYNFTSPLFSAMMHAFAGGQLAEAQRLQGVARKIVELYFRYGGTLGVAKEMMKLTGIDCGPVRLPLRTLDKEKAAALQREIDQADLLQYWMRFTS